MRRVILSVAMSIDGYIAGPEEEIDWLFTDQDYGMAEFFRTIDTALIGRKTFDFMRGMGEAGYKGLRNVVFSRSPAPSGLPGNVEWITEDPAVFVKRMREEDGKGLWLVGGGELFQYLLDTGLVDAMTVAVHPMVLGNGIPLFPDGHGRVPLDLEGVQSFESGLVILRYRVPRHRT